MSKYDEYICRLCKNRGITPDQAKELALSKEVEKYYEKEDQGKTGISSTYNPFGECV